MFVKMNMPKILTVSSAESNATKKRSSARMISFLNDNYIFSGCYILKLLTR